MSVLVVGSINADIFFDVPRIPLLGETLAATGTRCFIGGKGSNQAVAASQSKVDTTFLGQLGNDFAPKMTAYLNEAGVRLDKSSTIHADVVSGQATILLLPSGENSIIIVPGANAVWPNELTPGMKESIHAASVILLQCEIPAYVNLLVAKEAKAAGKTVVWDLGGEERAVDPVFLQYVDFVCPNETELMRMTHSTHPLDTLEEVVQAAKQLQKGNSFAILVTRGASGVVLIEKDGQVHTQSSFPCNVRDTTGAGDCFRGSFAAMLAKKKTLQECLLFATASSSLCVQKAGATMPSYEETISALQSQGITFQ